jgi:hypothetical protein
LDPIERWNLTLCTAAVVAAFALGSPRFASSLAVGAVLELINFRGLRRSGEMLFAGRLRGGWGASYGLRFGLLGVGIGVALYAGAHPVALVIGLSLIVPAAVIAAWRMRPPILEHPPAPQPDDPSWDRWNPWLARERDDEEDDW